ncbi:Ubiquitin-conjugating enzyme family protein [Trichomonas vaginalis G3]|uniref:Ubiquitin-conjugating enzyme family protein n=1 Tax=Trichomonas vaginalis (strain ATCC PRA-98 / G3) TaxID=412133 RepID=A2EGV7_TRIV3|nr:NEDD8 transferase protein [Trichomonas vaginalis G3]EAY08091.1 Ubiquitin-conjugating enzyme family protein [Trichomonas vaginalis G3]KAI5496694.1 NEDD8 transferase protein [Trichomonas vaginalis G3]|eukprot:XP_001320314.1 Ubiquitin-conjugating enzyme family protein [Trichomonas vaginalis G3]
MSYQSGQRQNKPDFATLRLMKDFEDIDTLHSIYVHFPDPNYLKYFIVRVQPESGLWELGQFDFEFRIPDEFPFQRPRVKCLTKIFHPNIDEEGSVCLSILREAYNPTVSIPFLIAGIQYLFTEPEPNDPLNKEAAQQMINDFALFKTNVDKYVCLYCTNMDPLENYEPNYDNNSI